MFKKLFSFFAALTLSVGLWAQGSVFTYTATEKLEEQFSMLGEVATHDFNDGVGTVTYSSTITMIEGHVFAHCTALQSITLPATLTTIGDNAFNDCEELLSITLPATLTAIGEAAFGACYNLESVTCKAILPPTCHSEAFCTLPYLYVPAASVEAYQEADVWSEFDIQALPAEVGDQFKDETTGLNFEITSLGTPKTVKVIPDKFDYSNSSYNIPSSVTYSNVEYTVTEIGDDAFYFCWEVTSITLPSTITTIGEDAFCFCVFSSIDLPAALTAIGSYAFSGCQNLQSIIVPANVTTIGYNAFAECTALQEVTFLGNACQNAIGNNVFYKVGATDPALLTLPDNWTGSKPDAGGNWYGGKFAVPGPKVDDQFVDAASGLKFEVTAVGEANTVKVIANSYTGTSYNIPATVSYNDVDFAVTEIGNYAFASCSSLQSITIPTSVTTIGQTAFAASGLTSITIPTSVTSIGENAFGYCDGLASVTFLGNACQGAIGNGAFNGVGSSTPALLTLPNSWTGTLPDEDGNWYGGKFELYEEPATTYTRDNLSNGKFGTICLAYAVDDLEGVDATFYQLNYFDESASALYLEEVDALAAGMPYIFEAKAESFTVTLTITDEPAAAGNENGLYGTLEGATMTSDATHSYAAISNNQVTIADEGNSVTVAANRAYIDMNEVSTTELAHKAPLRAIGVPRGQTTNNENVNADGNMNGKFIINGQFVIVKDGKKYNALGF